MNEPPDNPDEPSPTQPIAYATPAHLRADSGCWREGDRVVVTHNFVAMPPCCFKCGKPAARLVREKVYHPLEVLQSGNIHVNIPLCKRHYWKFQLITPLACLCMGVAFSFLIFTKEIQNHWQGLPDNFVLYTGISLLAISLAIFNFFSSPFKATRISPQFVTLKGAGKEFLEHLQEF